MSLAIAARPDTALADAADRMLLECSPAPLVNHCYRTYQFAVALLDGQKRHYDAEALYVASALHDLGLTDTWDDHTTPFEVRGAAVAYEALVSWDAPDETAALVREAIALHLEVTTQRDPRPEVAGITLGAIVDTIGLRLAEVPPALVEAVLERYPRPGFKSYLVEVLRAQAAAKPTSRIALHIQHLKFDELVAGAPFDS